MINPKSTQELIEEFKQKFLDEVRVERNKRLSETDYVYLPDVFIDEEYKSKIITYRQELRDIPEATEQWLLDKDLYSVSVLGAPWPEKP